MHCRSSAPMKHIKSSQPAGARGRWVEIVMWGTELRTLRTRRHQINGTKLESKLETPKANDRALGTLGTLGTLGVPRDPFYLNSVTDWERLLGTQMSNCRTESRTLVRIVALLLPTFLSLCRFFPRYALVLFLFFDLGMLIGNSRYYKRVRPVILRMSTS